MVDWPGNRRLLDAISRLRREQRLPHAILVIGMRGLPAAPYATMLASSLLCASPGVTAGACGLCADCRLVRADTHPDLLTVRAEGTQVRIDAVRDALAWAAYRPQLAPVRVIRLESADRMGNEAAVAALKGVEEPGDAVHWILSADAPGRVHLPLRSRCVEFSLRTVATPEIEAWLEALGVEAERAGALARGALGFPEDALRSAALPDVFSPQASEGEDGALAADLRRRLHTALRAGTLGVDDARAVLALWSLADQGIRRGSPSRLVADVLADAMARLPA